MSSLVRTVLPTFLILAVCLPGCNEASTTDNPDKADEVSSLTEISLGDVAITSEGLSDVLSFSIPEGAVSFTVVVEGQPDSFYRVDTLQNPEGVDFIDQESPMESINRSRWGVLMGNSVLLVPNSDHAEALVSAGDWKLRLQSFHDGGVVPHSVKAKVIVKSGAPSVAKGTLRLYLHFSGAAGITAESAKSNAVIRDTLQIVREVYSQVGITLLISEDDYLDDAPLSILAFEGTDGMDELSARVTQPDGLNIFFIEQFAEQIPFQVQGISSGLPGAPFTIGVPSTSIAVSISEGLRPPLTLKRAALLGPTLAHEMGHFLGLRHTQEQTGQADAISDTEGFDRQNLMFVESGGRVISPGQAMVLHNSALVVSTE